MSEQSPEAIPGIDELFEVAPEEFVKTRNALVSRLKSDGKKDAAARVAALRRPSAPVWAINQLARSHPAEIERYLEIQHSLASVSGGGRLSELAGERRKIVSRLTRMAGRLLADAGHPASSQTLQRIGATLLAADDPEEQELIRRGRLAEELSVSGFGGMSLEIEAEEPAADDEQRRAEEEIEARESEANEAAERADRLAEEAARLLEEADAAASEAREARKRADALAKEAAGARSKLKRS